MIVTRGPDRLVQPTTTDSAGVYRVRFEQRTGDYLVYVRATGLKPARRRVQRQDTEHEFVADFILTRDAALHDAIKVTTGKEIADSIVTVSQRELVPMFKSMLAVPMKDRENSQWQFGQPVTLVDKPRAAAP